MANRQSTHSPRRDATTEDQTAAWPRAEPLDCGTYTVEEAASLLGIGRTLAYELIRQGEFPVPVIRLGARRIVVPRAPLDELLGRRD